MSPSDEMYISALLTSFTRYGAKSLLISPSCSSFSTRHKNTGTQSWLLCLWSGQRQMQSGQRRLPKRGDASVLVRTCRGDALPTTHNSSPLPHHHTSSNRRPTCSACPPHSLYLEQAHQLLQGAARQLPASYHAVIAAHQEQQRLLTTAGP